MEISIAEEFSPGRPRTFYSADALGEQPAREPAGYGLRVGAGDFGMSLSTRERDVAQRYADGMTYRQIAGDLKIAPATVRNQIASIYRKLGVSNKPELIRSLARRQCELGTLPPSISTARTAPVLGIVEKSRRLSEVGASIAILPFKTLGPPDKAYFGPALSAEVQHLLSRCSDLLVSGRSSSLAVNTSKISPKAAAEALGVSYLLEGETELDASTVTVWISLLDGKTAAVLWSERYQFPVLDAPKLHWMIARDLAGLLSLKITTTQETRRARINDDALTAYDLRLRGNHCLEQGGQENLDRAKSYFARALDLNKEDAAALAGYSMCYGYECDLLLSARYDESLQKHFDFARKAVAVDPRDSRAHYALSCALMFQGEFQEADRHAELAVQLSPAEYHTSCNRGYSLLALGQIEKSVEYFEISIRRNPMAPSSCLLACALIDYVEEHYGNATTALAKITGYPVQRSSTIAAACAQEGYMVTARNAVNQFHEITRNSPLRPRSQQDQGWSEYWRKAYPYLSGEPLERLLDGLKKAALPV